MLTKAVTTVLYLILMPIFSQQTDNMDKKLVSFLPCIGHVFWLLAAGAVVCSLDGTSLSHSFTAVTCLHHSNVPRLLPGEIHRSSQAECRIACTQ